MSQSSPTSASFPSLPSDLPQSYHVLLQKQQEHAGLQALRESSADMLERVEKLAEMSNVMADGGEALGKVLKNWPHVFSILNLFDKQPSSIDPNGTAQVADEDEAAPLPMLVRLPYDKQTSALEE